MPIPSLTGDKVYLRPVTTEDALLFLKWKEEHEPQSQSVHQQFLYNEEETRGLYKSGHKSTERDFFAIVDKEIDSTVGKISYFNKNNLNRSVEFGLMVGPDFTNKGYAKEAVSLLLNYLFNFLNMNKVYATTSSNNANAVKLLESLSFKKDGTLREHHFYNGTYYDQLHYSKLKSDK